MQLLPFMLAASIFVLSACEENKTTETTYVTEDYWASSTSTSEATTLKSQQLMGKIGMMTIKSTNNDNNTFTNTETEDLRLSEMIRNIIRTYKEEHTVIIPGIDIPDPMPLPDKDMVLGPAPTSFYNMTAHGLSEFTVDQINSNVDKMQVYVAVHMKRLEILGNYTLSAFFVRSQGPFNVTLYNVTTSGAMELSRDEDGHLFANESQLDMTFSDTHVEFQNVGMVGHILQAAVGSVAPVLFEGVKPSLLNEINTRVRNDVNKKLKLIGEKLLANKTEEPLLVALEEARKFVRVKGYDPYRVNDMLVRYNHFTCNISRFVLYGLSDFHKVGDVNFSMDNGTLHAGIHLVSFTLNGKFLFTVSIGKFWEKSISSNFSVDHLQIRILVKQSLDMSQHPQVEALDLNVGNIKINLEGTGYFDGLIISFVNNLPAIIRHIIVDAIEGPLKIKAQQILNRVDMQEVVDQTLPLVDNLGL